MNGRPYHKPRVIVIADKVMPYRSALYREMAKSDLYDTHVLFFDAWGKETRFDPTMNTAYAWDGPVLDGFAHTFLKPSLRCRTTYTGIDRKGLEHLPVIGTLAFYLRVYFGILSVELLRYVASARYDVIQMEGYSSINYVLTLILAKLRRKKVLLRSEAYLHSYRSRSIAFIKLFFVRAFVKGLDGVLYSGKCGKEYYQHYQVPDRKLFFVPSAVDNAFFLQLRDELKRKGNQLSANKGNTESSRPIELLGVGRLVPRKNWMEAIRALEGFDVHEARLTIVGDGPERKALESYVSARNMRNISFVGFKNQSAIGAYYDFADVLLLTADYDPSPKVINEALVFGLPVILSDSIGTATDLCDGNGFLYRYGDINDLRSKIRLMIADRSMLSRFAARSLELSNIWSVSTGARNIESVISSLLPSSDQN